MKAGLIVFLFLFVYIECRTKYAPIDKNANIAFINMEGGAGNRPVSSPSSPRPQPTITPVSVVVKPAVLPNSQPTVPTSPIQTPVKPSASVVTPVPNKSTPGKVVPPSKPITTSPVTTPGPGSVKQLINYYDSQGKASPIRPYSYSQAVKQG